ncbi:ABC transporter ATP-binding protein [Actinocrispum wychmicini]|uniref:Putative ABC transport system ATP-binding protein n=1 Tax=Actinocrispum wychmicini TaxID=1213861 RepID=A0A4V2S868_9PSEU|nr:ABC transporter ATP-binding protein [Actinocrispum wychmicini]TCO62640.1 putative ABC transport system ATP-binding protein [Actinocrispum wychmicini]
MTTGGVVLRQAIGGQRRDVIVSSVLAAGHQAGEALVPVVIGVVIDRAVATGSVSSLLMCLAALAGAFVALSYSYRFGARAGERAAEQAAHRIRIQLSQRVLDPRGGAEASHLPGALVNIATSDAKRVGGINQALPMAVAALTGLLVSAIALLRISVPLGLLVLLGTPPLMFLGHLIGRPLERRSGVEQERAAHASGVAADLVAGLRVLKGIRAEKAAIDRYRRTSRDSLTATIKAARARAWHDGAILSLTGVFIALVALVGGNLAADRAISIGDLVAAVGLAQFLVVPLRLFAYVNGQLAQARASAARVAEVLSADYAVTGTKILPSVDGRVRLAGVCHGSARDVTFDVHEGEFVGVVASPATAADLLACLAQDVAPTGTIEVDGHDLADASPSSVREAVLVAAHDAVLFEGTLRENVSAAASGPVDRALAAAAAELPEDTHISERGQSLSGGQRQRVALARALAADPAVLVVHDPTTAVDAVTEARIARDIREVRRGRTTIALTTSPALLAVTDRVVLLADGVTTEGRHADLLHGNEVYRKAVLS